MDKDEDVVEFEITDENKADKTEKVAVEKKQETAAQEVKQQPSTEDALKQLRNSLESEKNARLEAEKRVREQAQMVHASKRQIEDSNLTLVSNALGQVKREAEILKANYRAALAQSDFEAAADAQEQMAMNAAKLLQLENGKAAMEAEAKNRQEVRFMPQNADPVEAFASQLSPRSADWVRKNPQFVTDARLNQKMVAAHNLALADGIKADTDDYFSFVESILKPSSMANQASETQESALSEASAPTQRRAAPPAAPVSRAGTASGTSNNRATLTPAEKEMAEIMGMSHSEYAKNKFLLQKEGKLN